ncbi:unnamed protein product [Pieris macdunnoughi]|uniref:Uncharacterized protein n=1 Tax=Pieris macdunnoughi TaxID=345717 RepID=A0A821VCM9_9NEOP|nr:unnamed protein product [Pieris macdunnoughi]
MEENESGVQSLAHLLAKRKKFMDLRNTIISIDKCRTELNTVDLVANHHSNPVTPYTNEQRSISPPPFSPLTPLIAMKTTNKNISLSEGPSNSGVLQSDIDNIVSVCGCSTETPSSSPLRPMSPETQELFNTLSEHQNILLDNRDISHHEDIVCDFNSDDSVRDPNFNKCHERGVNISESTTSCSSMDNNEACTNNLMSLEEQHNDIEVTSTTDILIEPVPVINDDDTVKTGRPKKGR